jgi:galactose mutarotase-like enzyme
MIDFKVSTHGAELQSLRKDGREYLWQGNPEYWGRRAPILFPIVGQVAGGVFRYDGQEYKMGQHGFARDAEFELQADGRYKMAAGEHPNYPFDFELYAEYIPEGNSLTCRWMVRNPGTKDLHFQIGAHPALNLPGYNADDKCHGFFQCLDKDGKLVNPVIKNSVNGGLRHLLAEPRQMDAIIPITEDAFADDAILIEDSQVTSVALLDKDRNKVLSVHCLGAQAFGLWAPNKPGCPFVCIEPWCGIADPVGFAGDISERELNHSLKVGESYVFEYYIELSF